MSSGSHLRPPTRLAIKVDVDTCTGLRTGVPHLMEIFKRGGIHASFFIPFGPDHSGRSILRVFRHRGFLKKMMRTKAHSTYGLRTLLSGTLLPGRMIGPSSPELLQEILREGHELGSHGYDHVFWHDKLQRLSLSGVRGEFLRGYETFKKTLGWFPRASAAPGWQCNAASLLIQDECALLYHSDTRGPTPYFPRAGAKTFETLEIPTTLPTWDELWEGNDLSGDSVVTQLLALIKPEALNVLTIHAEIEGGVQAAPFQRFLARAQALPVQFVRLEDEARCLLMDRPNIPVFSFRSESVPGRAGIVTCAVPCLA